MGQVDIKLALENHKPGTGRPRAILRQMRRTLSHRHGAHLGTLGGNLTEGHCAYLGPELPEERETLERQLRLDSMHR